MNLSSSRLFIKLSALSFALSLVSHTQASHAQSNPQVVATYSVLCDLTEQIAESTVDVDCLIGAGEDPHVYSATPADRRAIEDADLVLYGGYNFEPAIIQMIEATETDAPKVAVSEVAVPEPLEGGHHDHGHEDHDEHGDEDHDDHGHEDHDEHGDEDHDEHGDEDHDDHDHEQSKAGHEGGHDHAEHGDHDDADHDDVEAEERAGGEDHRAQAFLGTDESATASADFIIGGGPNAPPLARAGPDQVAEVGAMVLLNGAATDDPDGSNLLLSEQWSQVAGPPVVLGNDDETVAYFRPTQTGRYRFRLDVSDGFDADSDVTVVRVIECVNDVRDGLVARWGFEEGEGALARESASGLWNGALEGPAWSDLGVTDRGGTLDFDGVTDVVQVGGLDVAGAAMTLTAWIRPDDFDVADGRILSKASGVGEQDHHWMLSTIGVGSERRLRFRLRTEGTTKTLVASGGALVAGAQVQAVPMTAGLDVKRTQTGPDGTYSLEHVPAGRYRISAVRPRSGADNPFGAAADQKRTEKEIVVGEGDTQAGVDFKLLDR